MFCSNAFPMVIKCNHSLPWLPMFINLLHHTSLDFTCFTMFSLCFYLQETLIRGAGGKASCVHLLSLLNWQISDNAYMEKHNRSIACTQHPPLEPLSTSHGVCIIFTIIVIIINHKWRPLQDSVHLSWDDPFVLYFWPPNTNRTLWPWRSNPLKKNHQKFTNSTAE